MASLFHSVFSDSLVLARKDDAENVLPSPESLKGKIILKGKVAATSPPSSDSEIANQKLKSEKCLGRSLSFNPVLKSENSQTKSIRKVSGSSLTSQIVYCKKIHFPGFPLNGIILN